MRKGKFYSVDDYEITEDGQVINRHNGHVLKPQPNGKGYLRVWIGRKQYFVHRLVAEAHVPNPDNKPQVNHINGDRNDNRACNLEWVTNQENRDHAVKTGLHTSGGDCSWAKLTWENVNYIREHGEIPATELAKTFGVSAPTIRDARNYRTWVPVEKIC